MKYFFIVILSYLAITWLAGCTPGYKADSKSTLTVSFRPEEIRYFLEIAPTVKKQYFTKWIKPIHVALSGSYNAVDSTMLERIFEEVAPALGGIKIGWATTSANLVIKYIDKQQEYERIKNLNEYEYGDGTHPAFARPKITFSGGMESCEIVLGPRVTGQLKETILRHEIVHALGLHGHSPTFYNEPNLMGRIAFNSLEASMQWNDSPHFPQLDLGAIRILYDPLVHNFMTREMFLKAVDTSAGTSKSR